MRYILIVFLVSLAIKGHSQLVQIPSGTVNNINSISYKNGQIFFLGNNYLSKTYNYGNSVIQLNVPNQLPFTYALNVIDTSNLYLISAVHNPGYNYQILHSYNGGQNWNVLFDTNTTILHLTVNQNNYFYGVGASGNAFHSVNGQNWITEQVTSNALWQCASFSDSVIIIGGFQIAAVSPDLGKTWHSYFLYQANCSSIQPIDKKTVYVSSIPIHEWDSTYFYKTTDGGYSWTSVALGTWIGINDIEFISGSHGYAVGYNYKDSVGIILETLDSGYNWNTISTSYNSQLINIEVIEDSILFICGANGLILKSQTSLLNSLGTKAVETFDLQVYPNPSNDQQVIRINIRQPEINHY